MKNKSLVLFFSRKISLKIWVSSGLFTREKIIYEELLNRGTISEVFWLTYDPNDDLLANDLKNKGQLHKSIKIIRMPSSFDSNLGKNIYSILAPFVHYFSLREKSIFKTNQIDGGWTALIAKILTGRPLIFRFGYLLSEFLKSKKSLFPKWKMVRKIEEIISFNSNAILVNNSRSRQIIRSWIGFNREITLLPNFIDMSVFYDFNQVRRNEVVYVGRLDPHKNLLNLASACSELKINLNLYGEGELHNQLTLMGPNIILHGVVPNNLVPIVLNKYKYFALVSKSEGSPKSLLEAMACGCLCLGSDVEGIKEVLIHNRTGILCSDLSCDSIAKSLTTLMQANNHELLKQNSNRMIKLNFELSQLITKEESVLKKLLS